MTIDSLDIAKRLSPDVFSRTYFEAREKFLSAAPGARAYPCSASGPSGEDLFTDAAWFGSPDARNLLVLVSGTHGAEGYCGSAAQLVFLKAKLHESLPPSTAVLLVHALNCYGFAWDRRITAEGIDLNRNFVDFSRPVPSNPGYEELAGHLVPADISDEGLRRAEAAIAAYRSRHGEWNFQKARTTGQYTCPGGMFYGGAGPSEARRVIEQIGIDYRVADREQVVIIDYHTGLGPYGYGELQAEQSSGLDGYERARKIFGPSVTSPDLGSSSAVAITGCQDDYWERILGDRHVYVAFEFGTFSRDSAREAERGDNWLFMYHPEETDTEVGRSMRAKTKLHFYPQASDWEEMIVWRSHQVHRQAMEAFAR